MRYFKYKNLQGFEKNARKEYLKSLSKKEKRIEKWNTFVSYCSIIALLVVGLGLSAVSICALTRIPFPENVFLYIAALIGTAILGLGAVLLSFIIAALVCLLIEKASVKGAHAQRKEALNRATAVLREYYGLGDDYIVTKCYDASNDFKNRDVCIFFAEGELRITVNIVHGFSHISRDLGCYCFKPEEITVSATQENGIIMTVLTCGDTFFRLGKRAKGYIQKHEKDNEK